MRDGAGHSETGLNKSNHECGVKKNAIFELKFNANLRALGNGKHVPQGCVCVCVSGKNM